MVERNGEKGGGVDPMDNAKGRKLSCRERDSHF